MTPRQRAESILAMLNRPLCINETWWVDQITSAIQAASNEELERGRARTATVQAALQATLEDLAKAKLAHVASLNELSRIAAELDEAKKLRDQFQKKLWKCYAQLAECRENVADATEELAKANSALTSEQIAHGKTMRERDELAAALSIAKGQLDMLTAFIGWIPADPAGMRLKHENLLAALADTSTILAAHDRAVAARVLREVDAYCPGDARLALFADQYERGEREVPGE